MVGLLSQNNNVGNMRIFERRN